jgi:hypothetical protein
LDSSNQAQVSGYVSRDPYERQRALVGGHSLVGFVRPTRRDERNRTKRTRRFDCGGLNCAIGPVTTRSRDELAGGGAGRGAALTI